MFSRKLEHKERMEVEMGLITGKISKCQLKNVSDIDDGGEVK